MVRRGPAGSARRILIEQAAAEDPTHPQVFLANARFALNEGRITDVVLNCSEALRHAESPRWDAERKKLFQTESRSGLVAAYESRGDFESARTMLLALLEADPRNALLRQQLARASFLVMRHDEAFEELKRAFKDDPTLDPPELGMAQLLERQGRLSQGRRLVCQGGHNPRELGQGSTRLRGLPAQSRATRRREVASRRGAENRTEFSRYQVACGNVRAILKG